MTKLHWQLHPASAFAELAPQWQALCDASLRSPLLSATAVQALLAHFAQGDEQLALARRGSELVAATIIRRSKRLGWQTFQPSQMPLGPWLQQPGLDIETALQALLRALPLPAMMLGITQLDPRFFPRPQGRTLLTLDSITTGEIDLPGSFDAFLATLDTPAFAKPFGELMRRLRKAEKDIGPITLSTETSAAAVPPFIDLYADMESRSWKSASGTALTRNDPQANFYTDLLGRFAVSGRARMFTLRIGGRIAAAQIAILDDSTLYLLKTTYEPELRSLSPGIMLKYFMIRSAYQETPPVRRIEIYGKLNDSQKMWVTGSRKIYHLNAYRLGLLARAHLRLIAHGGQAPTHG